MSEVFISFRVSDGAFGAMLIQRELGDALGREVIFRSSDSISPGDDYVDCITRAIRRCQVVIVVMGPHWLELDGVGQLRLEDPSDWVYREIALAFANRKRVFPILLGAATMPRETDLPHMIARLSRCQYRRLDHRQFSVNMALIVEDVATILSRGAGNSDEQVEQEARSQRGRRPPNRPCRGERPPRR